ncbi:MAG: phosphoglucosamine mutase [Bacteroidales bacterium]|nr:phosphoglucosamine mutase [Bacteroidales bacterium]
MNQLIKSISGIRGVIGGPEDNSLNPFNIVRFTASYARWIRSHSSRHSNTIVVGRDARVSGEMVSRLVSGTLMGMGFDVLDIGLATTPTTEMAVTMSGSDGGIIITASHNPKQWNALKLLNEDGEFFDKEAGRYVIETSEKDDFEFAGVDELGHLRQDCYTQKHIDAVLALSLVDVESISRSGLRVAVDCVNSVGGIVIPELLKALGIREENIVKLNCTPDGIFPHNPEPLPQHLTEIAGLLRHGKADVGFVVDPDVDRLAIICENGDMFGEEYTLVSVADYVLSHTPGNTVSNLSSTRALKDVTESHGGSYQAAAVGELNVVAQMKATGAVIGGEGNGGVIYPALHYGRDALVGIALFLSHLVRKGCRVSELRAQYPTYFMDKQRLDLTPEIKLPVIFDALKKRFAAERITDIDGVKIDFADKWVHVRGSNTEPIARIYTEARTQAEAHRLAEDIRAFIAGLS